MTEFERRNESRIRIMSWTVGGTGVEKEFFMYRIMVKILT
jgi:hypothetical protein